MVKKHLGKGLRALIPEPFRAEQPGDSAFAEIPIDRIVKNPMQPREHIVPEGIESLCRSIIEQGVLQPIVVRPTHDGYELVAGERRWTAAKMAGLEKIPARIIRDRSPAEVLEISLVENLQREDLNPIEIAQGYNRLANEFGLTHQEISQRVGTDRSTVTNVLRLLQLPGIIQESIRKGELSAGHARAILGLATEQEQLAAFEKIVAESMTVRQAEKIGSRKVKGKRDASAAGASNPELRSIEDRLRHHFGTKVQIHKKKKEGVIQIHFYSDEELDRILDILEVIGSN